MIRPRGQIELRHRRSHQALTILRKFAELPYFPHPHVGITNDVRDFDIRESCLLNISRSLDACTDTFGRFAHPVSTQLFIIHSGDFDVNVNAIKRGTRDPLLVFRDKGRRTAARLLGVPIVTTWAGIHCSNERKISVPSRNLEELVLEAATSGL
jgi:hypothetical protein